MTRHRNGGLRKRCGCPRARWPKCPHGWHFSFQWRTKQYRLSLDRETGRRITSKTEAEREADRLRTAIRGGRYPGPRLAPDTPPQVEIDDLSFEEFGRVFVERYSKAPMPGRRRTGSRGAKASWRDDESMLRVVARFVIDGRRFGDLRLRTITEDVFETFLVHLARAGRASSTRNHYLRLFKVMGSWAVRKGYRLAPFIGPDSDLRQERWAQRNRRVSPDEETKLLAAAHPRLLRLIIGALETGARRGELLSLQWREVDMNRREIRLLARKTKDADERILPISDRLLAVLKMGRHDPAGRYFAPDAFVFGNEVGEPIKSVKTGWLSACRKAGIEDLHFHDLRHEAGSRFVEAGMPLHHVQEMLGHSDSSRPRPTSTSHSSGCTNRCGSSSKVENLAQTLHKQPYQHPHPRLLPRPTKRVTR